MGNLKCLKWVLEWSKKTITSENFSDYDNWTSLYVVVSEGLFVVVDWLVKFGVMINLVDRWGLMLLESVVYGNYSDLVKMFAKNGVKIKDRVSGTFVSLEELYFFGVFYM